MLDWIDVDVIDVIVEIFLVHDRVFPEPALPNAAFALGGTDSGSTFGFRDSAREPGFDAPPAIGVVVVAFGQTPQTVRVFGQYHDGDHSERTRALRFAECGTQIVYAFVQQPTTTLHRVDGKEAGTTLDPDSAIVGHATRLVAP